MHLGVRFRVSEGGGNALDEKEEAAEEAEDHDDEHQEETKEVCRPSRIRTKCQG